MVSVICGVPTRACLFVCLNVSFSHHTCSCLHRWSLWINYYLGGFTALQFSCWAELCGSLFWFPILPVQHPSLSTPHGKWFMIGIASGTFVHWSSFSDWRCWLVAACSTWDHPVIGLPWNLPAVPVIFAGPSSTFDGTTSQVHQLMMSLMVTVYSLRTFNVRVISLFLCLAREYFLFTLSILSLQGLLF